MSVAVTLVVFGLKLPIIQLAIQSLSPRKLLLAKHQRKPPSGRLSFCVGSAGNKYGKTLSEQKSCQNYE
jgi:hypothetical protein